MIEDPTWLESPEIYEKVCRDNQDKRLLVLSKQKLFLSYIIGTRFSVGNGEVAYSSKTLFSIERDEELRRYHVYSIKDRYHYNKAQSDKEQFIDLITKFYPETFDWFLYHPEWL